MRAPGEAQVTFAQESSIDMIAHELGIGPDEFRRINLLKDGDLLPDGKRVVHAQARKTLDAAIEASNWAKPKRKHHVGRGMSISYRVVGSGEATVRLRLGTDGNVTVVTTLMDQGAGAHTLLLQIVAEVLGLPMDRVRISAGNTDTFPNDAAPGASRVTHVAGMAAYRAAHALIARLRSLAAENFGCAEEAIRVKDGFCKAPSGKRLSFAEIATRAKTNGTTVEVADVYEPNLDGEEETVYFSAQLAEVEVDPETGVINLNRIVTAHDVGTIINPLGHQGQIDGGLVQGLGFTLMEDLSDDQGRISTLSLGDYKIPNINDIPKMKTVLVEEPTGPAPFHAKAIGENSIDLVAPAVANAVFDATGVRITELPLTAEKLFLRLGKE
jgi:CO/xanthine dehydrogenase Mo-binding subunit